MKNSYVYILWKKST